MERLQKALQDMRHCTRVGDRKAGAAALEEYLDSDDDLISKLNCNSVVPDKKGEKLTWTVIFLAVQDYFTKETEKGSLTAAGKIGYIGLVRRVFQKATRNGPLLNWNKIFDFVIQHLNQERYAQNFGAELMGLLKSFLEIPLYRSFVDSNAWIELITTLLKCHHKNYITTDAFLSSMQLCIAQGSHLDLVIPYLRTSVVEFYSTIIQVDLEDTQRNILKYLLGLIELCNQNAVEFRGILCQLGETVIPHLFRIPSWKEQEEAALVKFLLIQYALHMPYDCDLKSDAFYADNLATWKEILRSMYAYCIEIIEERANRRMYRIDENLPDRFLLLSAKCTKQISSPLMAENDSSDDEDGGGMVAKKKMRYKSFNTIISEIHRKPVEEGLIIWMTYVKTVLTYFPELIENKLNLSNLLYLGGKLFNTPLMVRKEFYEYFSSLLGAEKFLREQKSIGDAADSWSTVWDLTLKSITVCDAKDDAINLLRRILKETHPSNISPLLMLYVNSYMPPTKSSLQLLAEYLALTTLPVQIRDSNLVSQKLLVDDEIAVTACPRLALIRWLMQVSSTDISGFESLVAALLCSLIVKQTDALIKQEIGDFPESIKAYLPFEKMLFRTSFVQDSKRNSEQPLKNSDQQKDCKFIVMQRPAERLADAIKMDFERIPGLISSTTANGNAARAVARLDLRMLIYKVNLNVNVLNIIEKYQIGETASSGQVGFKSVLERVFDQGIGKCSQAIMEMFAEKDMVDAKTDYVKNIIRLARKLFSDRKICGKMRTSLNQKFSSQVVDAIRRVFKSNLANYVKGVLNNFQDGDLSFFSDDLPSNIRMLEGHFDNPEELYFMTNRDPRFDSVSLEALQFLIDYGIVCERRVDYFVDIMKDLLSERFSSANLYIFEACVLLISEMSQIQDSALVHDMLPSITSLLQQMCRGYHLLPHCIEKLWNLFKGLTPHFASFEGDSRSHFMVLVGTMFNFLKLNFKTPKTVYKQAMEALAEVAKNDPNLSWSTFTPVTKGSVAHPPTEFWVLEELNSFLDNKCQEVRQLVVDTICTMYEFANPFDYSKGLINSQEELAGFPPERYQERRKKFLDDLFKKLLDFYEIEVNSTGDEVKEEAVNRTSVVLSCLTRLIFAYPYCQKQNIMFLFLMVKLKQIDVQLAKRALDYASTNSTKTMCCYMSYVLKKVLKLQNMNLTVEDLPYQFFGCQDMNSFYEKFQKEICVEYFEQNKIQELEAFAKRLNMTGKQLIQECYGLIMARLTPGLAFHTYHMNPRGLNLEKNNENHLRLITILGGKHATDMLMANSVGDVILNLISLTFEPAVVNTWGCPEIKLSEPVPPHYPESTIEVCLEFLRAASPHNNTSLVGYLAQTSHQSIYKIMLHLAVRIHDAHDDLEKYWRLHQFSFFIGLLFSEPSDIFSTLKEFVCSFTFNTYLRLLKTESVGKKGKEHVVRFLQVVITFLTKLVQRVTEFYVWEMEAFFNPVVRGVVNVAIRYPALVEYAKNILNFLLVEQSSQFHSAIVNLDPFPSDIPDFQCYNTIHLDLKYGKKRDEWSLLHEFDIIMSGAEDMSKERLKFLRNLLVNRKRCLDRLVRNIEARRFSEECEREPVHNIIQMLIEIALSSTHDEEMVIEACKCLGEIGPVDLYVLVLPPYKNKGKIFLAEEALKTIIEIVSGYLSSEDIRLVTCASKVLRVLLEFDECAKVVASLGNSRLAKNLLPFKCTQKTLKKSEERVDASALESKLGLNEMNEAIDYRSWLTQLTVGVIECIKKETSLVSILMPLCQLRLDFCEELLPYVVYLCLYGGRTNPIVKRVMSGYFRNFFTKFVSNLNSMTESSRSYTPSSCGSVNSIIYLNKLALRSLIRVTQFLRRHPLPQENKGSVKLTPWDNNFWIDLNYLDVARAAQYCGAYLTSILYIEIAATEMDMNRNPTHYSVESHDDDSQESYFSQGASLYPQNRTEASKMEKLLLKAYSSIGEVDAAFGCGSARFADTYSTIQHVGRQREWARLLTLANGSSLDRESCSDIHVVESLKQLGACNILWSYLKGVETERGGIPEDLKQAQFECGWRLSNWDMNADKPAYIKNVVLDDSSSSHSAFQMHLYESIQSGITQDHQNHLAAIRNGYKSVHTELRHATLESSENLYGFMSDFQLLKVVEDFIGSAGNQVSGFDIKQTLGKWKLQDRIPVSDFNYQEPSLYLRNVLLRAYDEKNPRVNLENEIVESLVDLTSKAREASHLYYAESCSTSLSSFCTKPFMSKEVEIAKNKWAAKKTQDALNILNRLIKKSTHEDELYPSLLLLFGDWLAESHCERPTVILEKYLQRACSIYEKRTTSPQEVSRAYIVLAKYADAQYQNVSKYISSDVFQAKVEHARRAKNEAIQSKHSTMTNEDNRKCAVIMQRHSANDDEEIKFIKRDMRKFLTLALQHYLRGLKTSSEHDLLIFRAISLWLENGHESYDDKLIEETTRIFNDESMPSYKYIVVLHQLSARLNNKNSPINQTLKKILNKCAEEHPYHTLPILLTQALLHKDDQDLPSSRNSSVKIQLADRVQAAAEIVKPLKRNEKLAELVQQMESFWLALIKLANVPDGTRNVEGVKKTISSDVLKVLSKLTIIPVPTSSIPVLPSLNYKDSVVKINTFGKEYGLVGGINSPKKINCRGTNGLLYNMLLKGQDDLRQDAVMQQVFGVMNKLLQVEPMTKARRLHIRTYKVIPLSQRTGLIEWVENTQTFGDYLVGGNGGAHVRYRPNDYKPMECRRLMMDAKSSHDPERRVSTYMNICEHFKPVFRHFFFENFKEAGVFFEKRLAYTRSVATNSIVGYILGLGDRHVLNILIDKNTAEFIHIDLGVAFEQGRILPTPETIPFRLSRDVIDGMGISGVEGVFRRSCEMTMSVLRRNSEIILTVLQVLLYDPLYMWALTTDRVARVQPSDHGRGQKAKNNEPAAAEESAKERNNSASRVLLRLRQKLMGIEEEGGQTGAISSGSAISIEGHVSLLIQRAQDPEKLSKLFPGWQPYL